MVGRKLVPNVALRHAAIKFRKQITEEKKQKKEAALKLNQQMVEAAATLKAEPGAPRVISFFFFFFITRTDVILVSAPIQVCNLADLETRSCLGNKGRSLSEEAKGEEMPRAKNNQRPKRVSFFNAFDNLKAL